MIALLDTSVISQFTKQRPDEAVLRWLERVRNEELCLSAVTILEIRYGIGERPQAVAGQGSSVGSNKS